MFKKAFSILATVVIATVFAFNVEAAPSKDGFNFKVADSAELTLRAPETVNEVTAADAGALFFTDAAVNFKARKFPGFNGEVTTQSNDPFLVFFEGSWYMCYYDSEGGGVCLPIQVPPTLTGAGDIGLSSQSVDRLNVGGVTTQGSGSFWAYYEGRWYICYEASSSCLPAFVMLP